tara:strand:- start:63910 stop:65100 length:1191 start_codon:yes stop_codon:yes gene_type:complete
MHRRVVRVTVIMIMLMVITASAFNLFQTQQQIDTQRESEYSFLAQSWVTTGSLSELMAAQQAYVATGQDIGYWVEKVSGGLIRINEDFIFLRSIASTTQATIALDKAAAIVEQIEDVDTLTLEHISAEQTLMASDLIFTDGLELTKEAINYLVDARKAERTTYELRRQKSKENQLFSLGLGLGTVLLVSFLLLPVKYRNHKQAPAAENALITSENRIITTMSVAEKAQDSKPEIILDAAQTSELNDVAELCTNIGRVADVSTLEEILSLCARLVSASSFIVWVSDVGGNRLRPAIAHGYSRKSLEEIGAVSCNSENAATEAFRSEELQIVPCDETSLGSLVAPLLTPSSCVGIISAEIRDGRETDESIQATMVILAAQLATIVRTDSDFEAGVAQG